MSRLALCAIMKNEGARIERFVDQNLQWCDEIVLVDTGSTDDTVRKLAGRPVTLLSKPWSDDFSSARNYALENAKSDWIISLDCDECVERPFRDLILRTLETATAYAFDSVVVTVQGSQIIPTHRISIFRNHPLIRYEGIVHEQVVKSVREARLPIAILDAPIYHYPSVENQKSKNEFYRSLLESAVSRDPHDPRLNLFLAMDALTKRADVESALRYHIRGIQGEASTCQWPVEYAQNALSAAKLMRARDPSSALRLLHKALDVNQAFENDPITEWLKQTLFEARAMYLDLARESGTVDAEL